MGHGRNPTRRRTIAITVFMTLWGGTIGARLFFLQVVRSSDYKDRAESQHERVFEISPSRGPIYDRNGNELAVSINVDSLYAVASEIEDPAATAAFLADVLDAHPDTLESRLSSGRGFTWVQRKISRRQADMVRAAGIHGLYFQTESRRFYPKRELAAHVLGFVNLDNGGASGLEYGYDSLISGTEGRVAVMTDARGRSFHSVEQLPTTGASLTTTIDENIQYIVEREISNAVAQTRPAGVSVVVLDPANGEILAMANYPGFNPNQYTDFPEESWRNRAVSDVFEPGSTFKIVTAAAALEEKLTTLDELIDCQMGHITIFGHRINDHKPFGILSVREVLQFSSDVGIIKLGMRLGDERFADYITRMGFGVKTGVDLPGEVRGLFKPASEWSKVSVGAISMGQEIGVTPLQVVNMVATVANGGVMYRPFVVRQIEDTRTGEIRETVPEGRRVISVGTARMLHEALEAVVTDGTARNASVNGYTAAGKTGTAQKYDPRTGTYSLTKHIASFAGYAPARDPEVAVLVAIDEPTGLYHGGEVASPVFKRIVEEILRYRSVPPDAIPPIGDDGSRPASEPRAPSERPAPDDDDWAVVDVSFPAADGSASPASGGAPVPNFRGRTLREVTEECMRLGLRCQTAGSGVAVAQSAAPGVAASRGSLVQVQFSTNWNRVSTPERP